MQGLMNAAIDRILDRMRVTAIIPDALAIEVHQLAGRKTLTESIVHALMEWADLQRIRELNDRVEKRPLVFRQGLRADAVRGAGRLPSG